MFQRPSLLLSTVFNIRPDEKNRVLLLYAMSFLFFIGTTWGLTTIESTFYIVVGIDQLILVFTLHAIFSIVATAIYTGVVDQFPYGKVLIIILLLSSFAIIAGLLLQTWSIPLAFLALYVIVRAIRSLFLLHWWTYVNSFYDTRAARRIIPFVSSSARLGVIIASLTLPLLNRFFSNTQIIVVWMALVVLVAFFVWAAPRILARLGTVESDAGGGQTSLKRGERPTYLTNVSQGFRYVSASVYLRWMTVGTLAMVLVFAFLNYRAGEIFKSNFTDQAELSNFLAYLTGVTSLLMLPVEALFLSRIIGRIGLGNTSVVYPISTFFVSLSLVFFPNSVAAASVAQFDRTAFRYAVRETTNNLLYNAVSLQMKGRTRAFINGFVVPIGLLISSLLLTLLQLTSVTWLLPTLLVAVAGIYAVSAWRVRYHYPRALIQMLEQEDYSALFAADPGLRIADSTTLNWLRDRMIAGDDTRVRLLIAQLMLETGGEKALPDLVKLAESSDAPMRRSLIDIVTAADLSGKEARHFYTNLLKDPDSECRKGALIGLQRISPPNSEQMLALAMEMLQDPELEVRVQALPMLIRSGDFFYLAAASQVLIQLLEVTDPQKIVQGIEVLAAIGDVRFVRNLTAFLEHENDEVRLATAVAIESLVTNTQLPVGSLLPVDLFINSLHDSIERVRLASTLILGRFGSEQAYHALTDALADDSVAVRESAVTLLTANDDRAFIEAQVLPILDSQELRTRTMAALVLGTIDQRQYQSLIGAHLDVHLSRIYHNLFYLGALDACNQSVGISLLCDTLREENAELQLELFKLLSSTYPSRSIKVIQDSFQSDSQQLHANATEALEGLTTPQTARLIAELFRPNQTKQTLYNIGNETWNLPVMTVKDVLWQLSDANHSLWIRCLVLVVVGEIGRNQTTPPSLLSAPEINQLLSTMIADPLATVRNTAIRTKQLLKTNDNEQLHPLEAPMLSTIEKIIFLKEVPFFQHMTVEQLRAVANVCEEIVVPEDTVIFEEGDEGGALYVVVLGSIGVERHGVRKGSVVRLKTLGSRDYFGEMSFFDCAQHSITAIALKETVVLRLLHDPLIALARQHPNLSLELINVLSGRLREAYSQIAQITPSKPRELHRLYDRMGNLDFG